MRKIISIALIICVGISTLSLTSCKSGTESSSSQETESTSASSKETEATGVSSKETEATSQTTEGSENSRHPVSSIEFIREWIKENNETDEIMEQQG